MAIALFDPEQLSIDSICLEPALAPERLQAHWLRARFAAPPEWHSEVPPQRALAVPASVLIALVLRPEGVTVLLTQRTAHLSKHGGQISFPGGRAEPEDGCASITALRETEEEVGLARRHIEILGTMPDYYTGTGYCVTPVVGLVAPPFEMRADPSEVAEIFEVPLAFLMDGAHQQRLSVELATGLRQFYAMPYQRFFIWGATAGMLRNLFHFLRAG